MDLVRKLEFFFHESAPSLIHPSSSRTHAPPSPRRPPDSPPPARRGQRRSRPPARVLLQDARLVFFNAARPPCPPLRSLPQCRCLSSKPGPPSIRRQESPSNRRWPSPIQTSARSGEPTRERREGALASRGGEEAACAGERWHRIRSFATCGVAADDAVMNHPLVSSLKVLRRLVFSPAVVPAPRLRERTQAAAVQARCGARREGCGQAAAAMSAMVVRA